MVKSSEAKKCFLFRGINNAIDNAQELKSSQINRIYKRLKKMQISPKIFDHISGNSTRVGAAQYRLRSEASSL